MRFDRMGYRRELRRRIADIRKQRDGSNRCESRCLGSLSRILGHINAIVKPSSRQENFEINLPRTSTTRGVDQVPCDQTGVSHDPLDMLKPMRGVRVGHLNSQTLQNQTPPLAIPSLNPLA
jgi:hypothetical protein